MPARQRRAHSIYGYHPKRVVGPGTQVDDEGVIGALRLVCLDPGVGSEGGVVLDQEAQNGRSVVAVRPPFDVGCPLASGGGGAGKGAVRP